jgi:hypothetical protein
MFGLLHSFDAGCTSLGKRLHTAWAASMCSTNLASNKISLKLNGLAYLLQQTSLLSIIDLSCRGDYERLHRLFTHGEHPCVLRYRQSIVLLCQAYNTSILRAAAYRPRADIHHT